MGFRTASALFFCCVLLLMLGFGCGRLFAFGASENEALTAVASAEEKITICYEAFLKADAAGAEVSVLMTTLNEAGEFLSKAELAYALGDFDSAFDYAIQSEGKLDGFVFNAENLAETAIIENNRGFLVTVGGSAGASLLVVIGGLFVWRWVSRKYDGAITA